MSIERGVTAAVADDNIVAVARMLCRRDDGACGCRLYRGTVRCGDVDTLMRRLSGTLIPERRTDKEAIAYRPDHTPAHRSGRA